jgi:hypothetical protein
MVSYMLRSYVGIRQEDAYDSYMCPHKMQLLRICEI